MLAHQKERLDRLIWLDRDSSGTALTVYPVEELVGNPPDVSEDAPWLEPDFSDLPKVTQPLRVVLLGSMWDALLTRVKQLQTDPALKTLAEQRGLMVKGAFRYLQWDPEKKEYAPATQEHLSYKDAVETLTSLKLLSVHPHVVARFHAMRKLTAEMTSEVVPFTLEIQNRSQESQQCFHLLGKLSRNSCTHLIAATLRPAKLGRSPLANTVDRLIQEL